MSSPFKSFLKGLLGQPDDVEVQLKKCVDEGGLYLNFRGLSLVDLPIERVPEELFETVRRLSLCKNSISELTEMISRFVNLTEIDLSQNRLTDLPHSLSQLTELKRLQVSWNTFSHIPDVILNITSLESLSISGNDIWEIPDALYTMPNLKTTIISENNIDISTLRHDTQLMLSGLHDQGVGNHIIDRLFLGSYRCQLNLEFLERNHITHILIVGMDLDAYYPERFTYMNYEVRDTSTQILSTYFREMFEFIDQGRETGSVLVHCAAGVSRSATIVIAYLMRLNHWSFNQSHSFVKSKRSVIDPNPGFVEQLKIFEVLLGKEE